MNSDLLHIIQLIKLGKWQIAHELVQEKEGVFDYDRIHAFLHRVEGDDFNARWWYKKLGLPYPQEGLEEELLHLEKLVSEK